MRKVIVSELQENAIRIDKASIDIDILLALPVEHSHQILPLLYQSKSQLRQDLFVLSELDFKLNGYFVEFGAANGIDLSNTYLLEQRFHWRGILAEPARVWHKDLRQNRPLATIEELCVWTRSNEKIKFRETVIPELSTIDSLEVDDEHVELRENGKVYYVNSISLNDLLEKNGSPSHIDYLSIDTEGSEFEILSSLDFQRYSFSVITCEHNFSMNREKVYSLLTSQGYYRKYTDISNFDDWYVKK